MSEGKFDHFSDACHLFSATTNIVVTNIVKFLLVFSIDSLSFSVEHGVRRNNTKFFGFGGNNFELNWLEVASDYKKVSLFDGSVSILEVWNQVGFGEVTRNSFDCVLEGEDVDFSEIGDVSCRFDLHNIAESDSKIFADGFVHSDFSLLKFSID